MNNPLNAVPNEPNLDTLASILITAKIAAKHAQEEVLKAEEAIIRAVGAKDEGSFTVRCDHYKVTTTQPVRRTLNESTIRAIRREIPEDIFEAMFDYKPSLNVRLFKECQELRPEVYNLVAKAVTSKPGKISVKVEDL